MPGFIKYGWTHLAPADHAALARALTTILVEGTACLPLNPDWDDTSESGKRAVGSWYSIDFILQTPPSIVINASEGLLKARSLQKKFSIDVSREDVIWEATSRCESRVTSGPQHLWPFFRILAKAVHDIAAKKAPGLLRKLCRANKENVDAEQKLEVKNNEEEKEITEEAADKKLKQTILIRKDELYQDRKRRKMEEEIERKEKVTKQKILHREKDLDHALLVLKWKASAANLNPASNETPTATEKILEASKRGPKHDLCETCGEALGFCAHENCMIVGCVKCFKENFVYCDSCCGFVCEDHCNKCLTCENVVCKLHVQCDYCLTRTKPSATSATASPLDKDFY